MAEPALQFHTDTLACSDKLEGWRNVLAGIFDVTPPSADDGASFRAFSKAFPAGDALITQSCASPLIYHRSRKLIARSNVDLFLVHLCLSGGFVGQAEDREVTVQAGDVVLLDLGRESHLRSDEAPCFSLALPREALSLRDKDPHGMTLSPRSGPGAVLAAHLRILHEQIGQIAPQVLSGLATGTAALINACFAPSVEAWERAAPQVEGATLHRIKGFIAGNLRRPDLGPDMIAAHFRISRSRLYDLFDLTDGIQRYIQAERLKRCCEELVSPVHQHRRIFEIGHSWGFTSDAHFSRVFRRTFGMTPGEVRRFGLGPAALAASGEASPLLQIAGWAARSDPSEPAALLPRPKKPE